MRIAIANFSEPRPTAMDFRAYWAQFERPPRPPRLSLFEQPHGWGFHIFSLGVHLLDLGVADEVEFWDYQPDRSVSYHRSGVLRLHFANEDDLSAYLDRFGPPDLFVNHGRHGRSMLAHLAGQCFRVHVAALRGGVDRYANTGADCYLVDSGEFLGPRAMLYAPVVNTRLIRPGAGEKLRDFIYLAGNYDGKRHDLLLDAVRNTAMTGHLHPVDASRLDLTGTRITTSAWNEGDVVELLQTSRIAVYPGDWTSSPAAMWECVAAGLPIVVNRDIKGGKHLVVSGVTGELASGHEFRDVMQHVLANLDRYRPREYFETAWDTVGIIERFLAFFVRMGWSGAAGGRASPALAKLAPRLPLNIGFMNVLYSKQAERGGLGEHIAELSRELARLGHDVTILTSGPPGISMEGAVTVVRLGRVDRFTHRRQLLNPTFTLRRLGYMWRAARYVVTRRFDVVEAADGGFEHLFLLRAARCPVVVKLHGDFRRIYRARGLLGAVMHGLEGLGLRRSARVYASTSRYAETVAGEYGLAAGTIAVIPCGIALDGGPSAARVALVERYPRLAGKRIVLLSVGSSPGRKGASVFIDAARRVTDQETLFVLVCSRPAFLHGADLPPNLLVLEHLDKADFYALMALSAVVVSPSEFESFSITTYEAMLMGRPVIVSRDVPLEGPARDYPAQTTLDRADADSLATAIEEIAGKPGAAVEPALLADLREAYGIRRIAERTLDLYRDVIRRYRARTDTSRHNAA